MIDIYIPFVALPDFYFVLLASPDFDSLSWICIFVFLVSQCLINNSRALR